MSKKIVLKSVFAVVMVGFILSVSSCQKDEKKIIGVWEYESVALKDFSCSDPALSTYVRSIVLQSLANGVGVEVEFTKEGKAITINGGIRVVETYKVNGSKLTLVSDDYSETYDISFPEKKKMQWEMNMSAGDLKDLSDELTYWLEEEIEITKCSYLMTFTKK